MDAHSTPTHYCCQSARAKPDGECDGHGCQDDGDHDQMTVNGELPRGPQPTAVASVPGPSLVWMMVMMMVGMKMMKMMIKMTMCAEPLRGRPFVPEPNLVVNMMMKMMTIR